MKSHNVRTLLALLILSLSSAWNVSGRPPTPGVPWRPVQPHALSQADPEAMQGQAETAFIHTEVLAKTTGTNTIQLPTEPQFVLGTNTVVTGLMVDCLAPQQTWKMLNPSAPARDLPGRADVSRLPVKAALPANGDLAVHEPDFALLRFSFGSPPKVIKSQP